MTPVDLVDSIFIAGFILALGLLFVGHVVHRAERHRLDNMRLTIVTARDLAQAKEWYPPEMHDEVERLWREIGRQGL